MAGQKRAVVRQWWDACYDRAGVWIKRLVRRWRCVDAWALKPLSTERAWAWQLLAPAEYPFFIPLLAVILVFGVTVGPRPANWTPATLALFGLGLVLMLSVHARAFRSPKLRIRLLGYYLAILLLLGSLLVAMATWLPGQSFDPEGRSLRVHVGPMLALLLTMMLSVASWTAGKVVRRVDDEPMPSALSQVELFQPKNRGDFMGDTPGLALVSIAFLVPLRYPLQLLLPAALAALLVRPEWVTEASWTAGVAAWLVLYLGILFDRFMEILKTVGRLFFVGPQRILSVLVIAIAAGRWYGVHYINYLFDNPAGTWTIFFYIFFAYAVAWFYGFWCEILMARRFIRLLHPRDEREATVAYHFDGEEGVSRVQNRLRTITLHGAGRLKVEGFYDRAYRRSERIGTRKALTFLTPAELLTDFRTQLEDHEWRARRPDPLPRVRDLQRATYAYPGVTGLLVLACVGGPLFASYNWTAQPPEVDIVYDGHVNLPVQPLLFGTGPAPSPNDKCPALGDREPRIAVAASGGGTRAAIYTAAVLRGLAAQDEICKVVLVSGVSGGSAALAYFALNQDKLRAPKADFDENAWDAFDAAMAKAYIQSVLNAASDNAVVFGTWWPRHEVCAEFAETPDGRAAGWWPMRVRFGSLLAESFVCTMGKPVRDVGPGGGWGRMGDVRFGLILNTGMAGRFERESRDDQNNVPEQARKSAGDPDRRSDVAGGRLVLTNLPEPEQARRLSTGAGPRDLRFYTINDPEMSVARAAALSANFPPVFADAAIDERRRDGDVRFWVTDGGTVENRGTVTLYLTIGDALPKPEDQLARRAWPDLHVVIADVSAVGGPYKEGVGLGTVQAAGGQMGLALEAELIKDLTAAYRRHGDLYVHELPMPGLLRDAIGTHWMMPNGITVKGWDGKDRSLSKVQAQALVSSLFTGPDDASSEMRKWVCELPPEERKQAALAAAGQYLELLPHARAWLELMTLLGAEDPNPCDPRFVASAN